MNSIITCALLLNIEEPISDLDYDIAFHESLMNGSNLLEHFAIETNIKLGNNFSLNLLGSEGEYTISIIKSFPIEAHKRSGKGNKKRRRGGNGLR